MTFLIIVGIINLLFLAWMSWGFSVVIGDERRRKVAYQQAEALFLANTAMNSAHAQMRDVTGNNQTYRR